MSNDNEFKIDRRQFVIAGSTGLVGLSMIAPGLSAEAPPVTGSIGYWLGSERVQDLRECRNGKLEDVYFDVVPAVSLPQSDPTFLDTGLRVSVWAFRGEQALGSVRTVMLTSEVVADDDYRKERPVPFHVWSLERGPLRKESQPVGFNATVEYGRPVDLLLSLGTGGRVRGVRPGDGPQPDVRFRFSLEDGTDARIVRGVYFLGFSQSRIDWDRYEYRSLVEGESRQLLERTIAGVRPADFPYFVVAVDRGTFFENGA